MRGSYHQVGIFLSRLANMQRIVNVSQLRMVAPTNATKGKAGAAVSSRATVEAEFTLSAYTLLGGVENEEVQADS